MHTYLIPIFIAIVIITLILGKPYWREYKRSKVKKRVFTKPWREILQRRMPYFRNMPAHLQLQLKQHIQVFIAEKRFIGINGVQINDEIKVTIAAQACLLLLNRKTDYYPKLRTILIYPRAFTKQHSTMHANGTEETQQLAMAGESWGYGKVVLSWQDTVEGARDVKDGHNVVIHEFAHQLDQEDGHANGAPILGKDQNYQTWSSVLSQGFKKLQREAHYNSPSIFDYYGATNPAEFFAVASEVFFEKSRELHREEPKLYEQLSIFYRVDPVSW